jgi:hypothetical protein
MIPSRLFLRSARAGLLLVCVLATAALAASPALAKPTGKFAVFSDCPLGNPEVTQCIYSETTSGEVKLGNSGVPIRNTVVLQGGTGFNEATETESFFPAADGKTLSKTPEPVPGGLAGLVKCNEIANIIERVACELAFENGVTGVNAVTELAGKVGINEGNIVGEEGVGLVLPIKVKLENPFLGSECYVGSNAHPIVLNLTTGTTAPPLPNKPIKGSSGTFHFEDNSEYAIEKGVSLVENAFAAPGVTGCGGLFAFLIDPLVNAKQGLPAAAGNNTAILKDPTQLAGAGAVRESE